MDFVNLTRNSLFVYNIRKSVKENPRVYPPIRSHSDIPQFKINFLSFRNLNDTVCESFLAYLMLLKINFIQLLSIPSKIETYFFLIPLYEIEK